MRYFECKATVKTPVDIHTEEGADICGFAAAKSEEYCEENIDKFCACVTDLKNKDCTFLFGGNGSSSFLETEIKRFWKTLNLKGRIVKINEITADKVSRYIRMRHNMILPDDINEYMNVSMLRHIEFDEHIVDTDAQPNLEDFAEFCHLPELAEEAERINSCKTDHFIGHPVHYLFEENSRDTLIKKADVLIGSLVKANRLESGRVAVIREKDIIESRCDIISFAYNNLKGGTLIVSLKKTGSDSKYADYLESAIEEVCTAALKHKNDVLTIFGINRHDTRTQNTIAAYLKSEIAIVDFKETASGKTESMDYLSRLAAEKDIHDTEELRKRLDPNTNEYYISELDEIFNDYFSEHLRKTVFPAYTKCSTFKAEKKIGDGSAADKLSEMIGLKNVKDIITKSVNYDKLHEAYKERNIIIEEPARSMIFTGNPGTAKTTVARLTAKIFRENGILEHGNLIEVGRGDLVGQFVGWTAPIIQKYFRKAKGSILFIDEAYALVDDSNSYGDEAINTIVQEMENHRDDTVVIFAGYPDKMEEFLRKNPGLSSRIAFHVDFPDYSTDELSDILKLMAKEKCMKLTDEAIEKAEKIFEQAVKNEDFGNGRFVRNLLEQAMMNMAQRLSDTDFRKASDEKITTIEAEDIIIPELNSKADKTNRIGF